MKTLMVSMLVIWVGFRTILILRSLKIHIFRKTCRRTRMNCSRMACGFTILNMDTYGHRMDSLKIGRRILTVTGQCSMKGLGSRMKFGVGLHSITAGGSWGRMDGAGTRCRIMPVHGARSITSMAFLDGAR
jgi:hypothetical protein